MREDPMVIRIAGGIYGKAAPVSSVLSVGCLSEPLIHTVLSNRRDILILAPRSYCVPYFLLPGYLGISLDSMGQREKAMKMHEQAHIIAKEVTSGE